MHESSRAEMEHDGNKSGHISSEQSPQLPQHTGTPPSGSRFRSNSLSTQLLQERTTTPTLWKHPRRYSMHNTGHFRDNVETFHPRRTIAASPNLTFDRTIASTMKEHKHDGSSQSALAWLRESLPTDDDVGIPTLGLDAAGQESAGPEGVESSHHIAAEHVQVRQEHLDLHPIDYTSPLSVGLELHGQELNHHADLHWRFQQAQMMARRQQEHLEQVQRRRRAQQPVEAPSRRKPAQQTRPWVPQERSSKRGASPPGVWPVAPPPAVYRTRRPLRRDLDTRSNWTPEEDPRWNLARGAARPPRYEQHQYARERFAPMPLSPSTSPERSSTSPQLGLFTRSSPQPVSPEPTYDKSVGKLLEYTDEDDQSDGLDIRDTPKRMPQPDSTRTATDRSEHRGAEASGRSAASSSECMGPSSPCAARASSSPFRSSSFARGVEPGSRSPCRSGRSRTGESLGCQSDGRTASTSSFRSFSSAQTFVHESSYTTPEAKVADHGARTMRVSPHRSSPSSGNGAAKGSTVRAMKDSTLLGRFAKDGMPIRGAPTHVPVAFRAAAAEEVMRRALDLKAKAAEQRAARHHDLKRKARRNSTASALDQEFPGVDDTLAQEERSATPTPPRRNAPPTRADALRKAAARLDSVESAPLEPARTVSRSSSQNKLTIEAGGKMQTLSRTPRGETGGNLSGRQPSNRTTPRSARATSTPRSSRNRRSDKSAIGFMEP